MDVYGFGQYSFDNWRNFVLLEQIPPIESSFLNWLIVLWVQIFLLTIALVIGFWKLYQQSNQIHNDVINPSNKISSQNKHAPSRKNLYIPGLHNLVSSYYQCKVMAFREVKKINNIT